MIKFSLAKNMENSEMEKSHTTLWLKWSFRITPTLEKYWKLDISQLSKWMNPMHGFQLIFA